MTLDNDIIYVRINYNNENKKCHNIMTIMLILSVVSLNLFFNIISVLSDIIYSFRLSLISRKWWLLR